MTEQYSDERRNFFKTIALLGGAAASLSLTGKTITGGKPIQRLSEKTTQGYRETEHIKKYYQSVES